MTLSSFERFNHLRLYTCIFYLQPPKTFRNGWTADRAYQTCYDSIKNAVPENVYNKYVDVPVNSYVKSCVSDIEVRFVYKK